MELRLAIEQIDTDVITASKPGDKAPSSVGNGVVPFSNINLEANEIHWAAHDWLFDW